MPRTLFETPLAADTDTRAACPRREAPPPDRLRTVVEAAVSVVFSVDMARLHAGSRGEAQVAHARQVAMYLMHCAFSLSHTDIGRAFGRDRTTVGHACAIVEDRRDAPVYDRTLSNLEEIVRRLATVSIHHEGF